MSKLVFSRVVFFSLVFTLFTASGLAQSGIITTYVGPLQPVNGDGIRLISIAADGAGGFYIGSDLDSRVYRVTANGVVNPVAGSGTSGFSGDGGPATSAQLSNPLGVAVDAAGNLYIADAGNHCVRKVTAGGVISTVAGNGTSGFTGDGGLAISAQLFYPSRVTVDAAGNLYVFDFGNKRIRKVTAGGVISTVAGNGTSGFSGDGGPATSAQLSDLAAGVAVDAAGNLYINDFSNHRIRKVTAGGVISTVVGNGTSGFSGDGGAATSAQLSGPRDVSVDGAGNLYIADSNNLRVRKVTAGGVISTVAGNGTLGFSGDGGPATSAQLSADEWISVDGAGNLYIADFYTYPRVRRVTVGGVISTVLATAAGFSGDGGPATSAQLSSPLGVAVDAAGNLYVADSANNRVRKVTAGGVISIVAGSSGYQGLAPSTELYYPSGVAVDAAGNLYVADTANNRVRKVTAGGSISTVAGNGVYGFSGDGGLATSAQLYNPGGVAVDAAGNLYIADSANNRVRKVTTGGVISTVAGSGTPDFSGDGGPATSAQLLYPSGVAVDAAGNLYVADQGNNRVRKVTTGGTISTVAGNGAYGFSGDGGPATSAQLLYPSGVAVDAAGNLYVADIGSNRVRKVTAGGVISTAAGSGTLGFSGDGGPATSAQLYNPSGVAVDAAGNLYIADSGNNRVRRVASSSLSFVIATASPLPPAGLGVFYSQALTASGGTPPYSNWTITSGDLPNGLSLNSATGTISGTAIGSCGVSNFTVRVSDGTAATATASFQIAAACTLTITTPSPLPLGTVGVAYTRTFAVSGGTPPYSNWTVTTGNLPAGLTLNPTTGVLSGTPIGVSGVFNFVVGVRDSASGVGSAPFQLTIQPPSSSSTLSRIGSFAQVVSGGGWKTTMTLINLSSVTVNAQINLYADSGSPMSLPLTFPQFGLSTTALSVNLTLSPNQSIVVESDASTSSIGVGWADVQATGVLSGYSVFRLRVTSLADSEGTATLDSRLSSSVALPYDNTNSHRSGIALANQSSTAASITATLLDQNGVQLASSQISVPALGHASFFVDERFSQAANQLGVIQFQGTDGITGVGLRFSSSGSFTSVPIIR